MAKIVVWVTDSQMESFTKWAAKRSLSTPVESVRDFFTDLMSIRLTFKVAKPQMSLIIKLEYKLKSDEISRYQLSGLIPGDEYHIIDHSRWRSGS